MSSWCTSLSTGYIFMVWYLAEHRVIYLYHDKDETEIYLIESFYLL